MICDDKSEIDVAIKAPLAFFRTEIINSVYEEIRRQTKFRSSSRHVFTNFPTTNLRFFSTKYYVICIWFDFSYSQNWEKKCLIWPIRNLSSFSTEKYFWKKNLWVCKYSENSWKHVVNSISAMKMLSNALGSIITKPSSIPS